MTFRGWFTIFAFAVVLTALALPLGRYMARRVHGRATFLSGCSAGSSGCCTV